ncbi:FMN-binding negative transcriptional regulator [Janthinobacterium psychrotolerans]|uniref:Transcriptional regulator n=1 Tax=Janthinobacterium psychrotolerans TaxID=1747903 RepID=A0A1A7BX22_9BURK|nr:FMN-binding negative transcriptional regulator [Janthinobacterium psychrotolerans]OBV37045.1 transcriptional regulator [Janthinobacterium psychrotolerans]
MYTPKSYREERLDVLHALMAAHPLGALVRMGEDGLCADHLPFEIAPPTPDAPFGTLRAHVARANPLWRSDGVDTMVIFQGPQAYITPAWYAEKDISGEEVPTFDYAVVHAHGRLRVMDERAWLLDFLQRLTNRHEAGQPQPWQVSDAPPAYIDKLLKAIVGIEIPLTRLEGKWKMEQKNSLRDRTRVARELSHDSMPDASRQLGAMIASSLSAAS